MDAPSTFASLPPQATATEKIRDWAGRESWSPMTLKGRLRESDGESGSIHLRGFFDRQNPPQYVLTDTTDIDPKGADNNSADELLLLISTIIHLV